MCVHKYTNLFSHLLLFYLFIDNVEWVPFDVDTDPTTDSSDVWGFAPMRYAAGDLNIPLKTGTKELSSTSVSSSSSQKKKKKVTTKREITVHEESKHSGELWYIFQLVDAMIDVLETSLKGKIVSHSFFFCL